MDADSSIELLARLRDGDEDALEILLQRHVPALRRWARGRLPQHARDLSETEDIVQETVFKSLKHLDRFEYRHDGALQAYLRQAVMNRIRDECRRAARRPAASPLDEHTPDAGLSAVDIAIGVQNVERYERALAGLREEDREAIVGRIEMDCSYEALAALLGKPSAGAARVAVSRALVRLARLMSDGH